MTGLPDEYKLPANVNEALRLMGDGVAVLAVRFLAENFLTASLDLRLVGTRGATPRVTYDPKRPQACQAIPSDQSPWLRSVFRS